MQTMLTVADLLAVLDCVHALHAEADAAALPMAMLRAVGRVVRSPLSAFTQVDPVLGESSGCLCPPEPWTMAWTVPRFQANIADHPVIAYAQRTRDGQAKAISDFLTARQFHATGLYRDLFAPMGLEDQLSIGMVGSAGLMIGLSFNRRRRGFSARDRAALNLLRPHLLQAYVSCRDREALRNADGIRRGTVVDRLPVGLVCINAKGAVVWATDPAGPMFRAYYPDAADTIHGLPHAVRLWLRRTPADRDGPPLVGRRPGFELRVRRCPLKAGHAVLLVQEGPAAGTAAAPSMSDRGFTPREAEVMATILTGSTPADAAAALGISPRTVQKHLERVFAKLGVNSLSAACVTLLGRPPVPSADSAR